MPGYEQAPPRAIGCPFCGLLSGLPHETQEGCIAALSAEVARMRDLLDHLRPAGARPTLSADPDNAA